MNRLRRIINNIIISFLGQALSWASTFLLTIAYGHYLGAFKYGELYFAIAFITLIGIPINSSYTNQIIRDIAQEPDKAQRYFSNIVLIKLGFWPILSALALLLSWLLGYSWEVRVLVAICSLILLNNALATTFSSLHYAFERTVFPTVGTVLENGLTALFGILLLKFGAGVQMIAFVMLIGSLVNVIWQAIWFFRLIGFKFIIDLPLIREIVRINIPFLLSALLLTSYTSIDIFLLSLMTNSAVVGWFGAGNRLVDAINFIPYIVITTIMYPIFSKLSTSSDADLKLAVEKSLNFLLFCSIPIATGLIVAAPNIIGFLYSRAEFVHSIPSLQALAPGVIFVYINFVLYTTVLSKKQERKALIITAIALVFNLGLNLILIPLYQHIGAAIVSSLTEVLLCCIIVVLVPRHLRPFKSLRVAIKALVASLVMAAAILPLHTFSIFVILPIAMLVYLGAALLFEVIPREDYQAVYSAIRQKVQLSSNLSTNDLPETPAPKIADTAQSRVSNNDETSSNSATTSGRRPLKAIRLQPMRQRSLTQQDK